MKITLTLPDSVWGRIASAADTQGVKVSVLLEKAISDLAQNGPEKPKQKPLGVPREEADLRVNAQMEILLGLGYSPAEVSRRVGMSAATIRNRMKILGLESNTHRKKRARLAEES